MSNPEQKGEPEQPEPVQPLSGEPDRTGLGEAREVALSGQSTENPYKAAEEIFNLRVEQLQRTGEMLRLSEVADDEQLDERLDQLNRVYRQVCLEMSLPWPPSFDTEAEEG